MRLPIDACASALVSALASLDATVRRRAAGAVCNACSMDAALSVLADAGAAAALAKHLAPPYTVSTDTPPAKAAAAASAALSVSLRALERLCVASATAREEASAALPEGKLLSYLADQLGSAHPQTRASASRIVAALSRSEARHWLPPADRPPPRKWPVSLQPHSKAQCVHCSESLAAATLLHVSPPLPLLFATATHPAVSCLFSQPRASVTHTPLPLPPAGALHSLLHWRGAGAVGPREAGDRARWL